MAVVLTGDDNDNATFAPTATNFPSLAPTWSTEGFVKSLLPYYTLEVLDKDNKNQTAQSKAFNWLMEDPLLDSHDDWRIIQKFALATFYYATGGESSWFNKKHWLNHSIHECLWVSQENDIPDWTEDDRYHLKYSNPCEEENPSQNISEGVFQHLWFSENRLEGTLPPELYLLTSLKSISIGENKGLQGAISPLLGDLTSLQAVIIHATFVSGWLPTEVGLLQNLTTLLLGYNVLSGPIPSELGQCSDLLYLGVDTNVSIQWTPCLHAPSLILMFLPYYLCL